MDRQQAALAALLAAVELLKRIDARLEAIQAAETKPVQPEALWMDRFDVMKQLHISSSTLYRLRKSGLLAPSMIRGKEFYLIEDIRKLLYERKGKN